MDSGSRKLAGKTVFVTGATRGIGKAIAMRAARDGANIVIAAKTAEPHPKLPGTIYSVAKELEAAGGKCLPCIVDVRNEDQVINAVNKAVEKFGGIDILVNNASAISLTSTADTDLKRYDLIQNINTRGTFLVSKACLPHLKKSSNPHILILSPPLNMSPMWFQNHLAYTISKYGMSMCALGMAEEFRKEGIAVNALWPKTAIQTAAVEDLTGKESSAYCRKPEIMADAAYAIFCKDSRTYSGHFAVDEDIMRAEGLSQSQIDQYACDPSNNDNLMLDIFLDEQEHNKSENKGTSSKSEVERIFSAIQTNLNEQLVKKIGGVYQFNLKGSDGGTWYLDLKNGSGSCGKGKSTYTPDAILVMDSWYFTNLFTGNLKLVAALMAKKIEVYGDFKLAMKLETLMEKSKL